MTEDGRQRLVVVRPSQPPYDTTFSHTLFDRLGQIRAQTAAAAERDDEQPPLDVQFAGGHRIALEVEALVRRESLLNGAVSLALILPLLLMVFRSPWLVAIGALPSAISLLVVLGVLGFVGVTLSAAATGAAAMLFGLGVDGVVLLYVAHRLSLAEGADAEGAIRDLGGPATSMLLGMWTTAATFLGLVVVDFPSLEQLGLLIGASMLVCGALTLAVVPASLPRHTPARVVPPPVLSSFATAVARRRRWILGGAGLATIVLAWSSMGLRINPTLERLRAVTPGAALQSEIAGAFRLPTDVYVVLAQGADLEALLRANEELVENLRSIDGLTVRAPSMLLPSRRTQEARAARIRASVPSVSAVKASLAAASARAGFRPDSFGAFEARLPGLVSGDPLTWQGLVDRGLGSLVARSIARTGDRWVLATYALPTTASQVNGLEKFAESSSVVLTGMPLVNDELGARFLPQFVLGLATGTVAVLLLIVATFRSWRLSLLALVPTALALVWAAGLLAWAGVELDLFAVFAVVTFIGIGVDYGVHLVYRTRERGDAHRATAEMVPVILVAGTITLLGYGTLVTSSYPPLQSIGLVSAVTIVTLVAASALVLPAVLMTPARGAPSSVPRRTLPGERRTPRRWTLHGLNNGLIFGLTVRGVRILPRAFSYGLGHLGAWIAWRLMPGTNAAVAHNLRPLYPDRSEGALRAQALKTYRNYTRDTVDFLRALSASDAEVAGTFALVAESARLFDDLMARGRGAILVTGHYGNWEIGGILMSRVAHLPLTVVAMAESDPEVNRLRHDIRRRLGVDTLEVRQALDTALHIRRLLGEGRFVALLIDRHLGKDRVLVRFLGRPVWFLRTPALMGYLTGAPLVACFLERQGAGRFTAVPSAPIEVDRTLPRDEAIAAATQKIAEALEARVRTRPDLWYQFYRYWDAQRDDYEGLA
ncbi:MAG: MMPL family transporter [Acidobacteria bacterium]|nr:MMPL family transporter [Acidobacteriota bacterium]